MEVCATCFADVELVNFIESNSIKSGFCDFCQKDEAKLINLEEIADFFAEYFSIFSPSDSGFPLVELIEKDWKLFSAEDKGANLLAEILTELNSPLNPQLQVNYVEEIIESTSYWEALKQELKWSRRFLTDVDNIIELGWDAFFNKQIELTDEVLFRARIHRDDGVEAYNIQSMGCPQRDYATSGRANPQGIPYLYLSKSHETTFYETRAAYLDEVSVGKFKIKEGETVVLVDFTEEVSAFSSIGTILDYTKSVVLKKSISIDLSKPLRRYDSELEYIPTQFICEFIRYITAADGIIFDSSLHVGGKNIVLFDETKMECFEVKKYQITHVNIEGEEI